MKKIINEGKLLIVIVILSITAIYTGNAQVTIGSGYAPHSNALLDMKQTADGTSNKGMLLPRVSLVSVSDFFGNDDHQEGMIVYNNSTSEDAVPVSERVSPGFYYNNGKKWEKLQLGYNNWFYMPSVPFDTSAAAQGSTQTKNLYEIYRDQFREPKAKNDAAPVIIPNIPAADQLYYYITDYDDQVFLNVKISDKGEMSYNVEPGATDYTFLNIVFVIK